MRSLSTNAGYDMEVAFGVGFCPSKAVNRCILGMLALVLAASAASMKCFLASEVCLYSSGDSLVTPAGKDVADGQLRDLYLVRMRTRLCRLGNVPVRDS